MKAVRVLLIVLLSVAKLQVSFSQGTAPVVTFSHDKQAERVDVLGDGKLFTSYLYTDDLPVLKKPILFPINTANGRTVTRGYPLAPRPGEQVDHPHQIGLWFNYGDVNGLDFWNNSDAIAADHAGKMGTVRHREIRRMEGGDGAGVLEITADWLSPQGKTLLREETRFTFIAPADARAIERVTTLTALEDTIRFADSKEGMLGLRVARELEHVSDEPSLLVGADGKPASEPIVDNERVSGRYLTSEEKEGNDAWGTRARWVMLTGLLQGDSVTVAMLDHPDNLGYPTYWMARGYGLFGANPLGQAVFSNGKETLNFALAPNASTTFRHRILLYDGRSTPEQIEADWSAFSGMP